MYHIASVPYKRDTVKPEKKTENWVSKANYRLMQVKLLQNAPKKVSEYDQEIPQSQTADNPVAPRGRAAQPSRDTRKTN